MNEKSRQIVPIFVPFFEFEPPSCEHNDLKSIFIFKAYRFRNGPLV